MAISSFTNLLLHFLCEDSLIHVSGTIQKEKVVRREVITAYDTTCVQSHIVFSTVKEFVLFVLSYDKLAAINSDLKVPYLWKYDNIYNLCRKEREFCFFFFTVMPHLFS